MGPMEIGWHVFWPRRDGLPRKTSAIDNMSSPHRIDCDSTGDVYCLNGGSCRPDNDLPTNVTISAHPSCQCSTGFTGPHCELDISTSSSSSSSSSSCSLVCKNGGNCEIFDKSQDRAELPWPGKAPSDHMHCVCPPRFGGFFCEYHADICGDFDRICLHGSRCAKRHTEDVSYECNCPSGASCQQHRIEFCLPGSKSSEIAGLPPAIEYYGGMAVPAFCVNDGKCRDVLVGEDW
jgi:hypothetical protein